MTNTVPFHFYEILRVVKVIKTSGRRVVAGGRENGGCCLMGIFQFKNRKMVMDMDGGYGWTTF